MGLERDIYVSYIIYILSTHTELHILDEQCVSII